jgi:beta-glucosidase
MEWQRPDADLLQADAFRASIAAAKSADAAIVCVGQNHSDDTEGKDRAHMRMSPMEERLLDAVAKANPRTIAVIYTGSPLEMSAWIDHVPAVVLPWYAGMENGTALARVLLGEVNPSGHLPITFPVKLADSPAAAERQKEDRWEKAVHAEGIFMGYRWFDHERIAPLFPFGHGLSYTTFDYSNLRVPKARFAAGEGVEVSVDVTNTGMRDGDEVVQLYVQALQCSLARPLRELKAFRRIHLKAGEKRTVSFQLDPAAFAFWNTPKHRWETEPGDFQLEVGSSSRDLRLGTKITCEAGAFWSEAELMKLRRWQ